MSPYKPPSQLKGNWPPSWWVSHTGGLWGHRNVGRAWHSCTHECVPLGGHVGRASSQVVLTHMGVSIPILESARKPRIFSVALLYSVVGVHEWCPSDEVPCAVHSLDTVCGHTAWTPYTVNSLNIVRGHSAWTLYMDPLPGLTDCPLVPGVSLQDKTILSSKIPISLKQTQDS